MYLISRKLEASPASGDGPASAASEVVLGQPHFESITTLVYSPLGSEVELNCLLGAGKEKKSANATSSYGSEVWKRRPNIVWQKIGQEGRGKRNT